MPPNLYWMSMIDALLIKDNCEPTSVLQIWTSKQWVLRISWNRHFCHQKLTKNKKYGFVKWCIKVGLIFCWAERKHHIDWYAGWVLCVPTLGTLVAISVPAFQALPTEVCTGPDWGAHDPQSHWGTLGAHKQLRGPQRDCTLCIPICTPLTAGTIQYYRVPSQKKTQTCLYL